MIRKSIVLMLLLLLPGLLAAAPAAAPAAGAQTPVNDLVNAGLKVMALGMLGVFAFLVIMVLVISLMAAVFRNFGGSGAAAAEDGIPKAHVAAISAAVTAWLQNRQKQ